MNDVPKLESSEPSGGSASGNLRIASILGKEERIVKHTFPTPDEMNSARSGSEAGIR